MTLAPFVVENFKGLRLDVDPIDIGVNGAVDLLNVDFDILGSVRTRSGSSKWSGTAASSSGYQAIFRSPTHDGEFILVRGSSGGSTAVDRMPDGGTISNISSIGSNVQPIASAVIGTTTTTTIYFTVFTSTATGQTIRKYDGTTLGTGTGKPTHVATWPMSNRLVQGGYFAAADSPSGANGSRSTVFFSDPGAPDTYGANNFVTLRPGDGEAITSIVSWRDLLFVFKESSVFIFYGEGTDGGGNPVFSYRRVDLPDSIFDFTQVPVSPPLGGFLAIPGPDAVYYSTPRGIYRTAGEVPSLFSGAIAPAFQANTRVASTIRTNGYPPNLTWAAGRLIASYKTASSAVRQFVYHAPSAQWTLWSLPGTLFSGPTAHLGGDALLLEDVFWFVNGNDVWVCTPSFTSDGGSGIDWSYTSGIYSVSNDPGRVAVVQDSSVVGWSTLGAIRLDVNTYLGGTESGMTAGANASVGGVPGALAEGWINRDVEGKLFQHSLSGIIGSNAAVDRVTHYVSFVKPAGME